MIGRKIERQCLNAHFGAHFLWNNALLYNAWSYMSYRLGWLIKVDILILWKIVSHDWEIPEVGSWGIPNREISYNCSL